MWSLDKVKQFLLKPLNVIERKKVKNIKASIINHSACMPFILKKSLGAQICDLAEASARALVFEEVLFVFVFVKFKRELKSVESISLSAYMIDVFTIATKSYLFS